MTLRKTSFFLGAIASLLLLACGDGDDDGDARSGVPDAGGSAAADAGPTRARWRIEYDLTGSQFDIRDTPFMAGDATLDLGPGRAVLTFEREGDALVPGDVSIVEYSLAYDFEVAGVATSLVHTIGPDDCGAITGEWSDGTLRWFGPVPDYTVRGTVTCNAGSACGLVGLPQGEPVSQDSVGPRVLGPFELEDDASGFVMDWEEAPNERAGRTFLRLVGTEVSRTPDEGC